MFALLTDLHYFGIVIFLLNQLNTLVVEIAAVDAFQSHNYKSTCSHICKDHIETTQICVNFSETRTRVRPMNFKTHTK